MCIELFMGHGVAVIIYRIKNNIREYLLFSPKKLDEGFEGFYRPLGGWIDDNEKEYDTVIREVKEEIDVVVTPIRKIDETPGDIPDLTLHWWLGKLVDNNSEITLLDSEIDHIRWFNFEEIVQLKKIYPATKRIFEVHEDLIKNS